MLPAVKSPLPFNLLRILTQHQICSPISSQNPGIFHRSLPRAQLDSLTMPVTCLYEEPQPESGFGRGNGVHEEPPVVINNSSNDDNNGNRNNIVFCDGYSDIGGNDQEGSSYSLKVNIPKMNGNNYNEWAQTVRLILDSKPYMFLPSAKDVWETVKETYSDIQNSSQIFGLKSKLWHAKQGDRSVTVYYNELLTLWQELDLCYDDNWRCTEDSVLFLKRQENDRVFMFLVGLNKDLDDVRGRVLRKVPLPTLREIFAEIRREEARQGIMMGKTQRNSESEGLALATRNLDEGRRSDKVPWCDHCKREWHTRETCWKLKAKAPNWKKKSGRAFQASNSDQGQRPPPSQFHSLRSN
ncbi:hypothetical protein KIW84_034918 [Lathyrus oleraceus]|uniref:Retrotransposon gag domain-containing protein n=1 Tax=Pisum sativum TaxID=3888 RepID=A0A9D4Y4N9_PEA|nr:hypothetical protein KIW84_034918 [Pisum sativum]